jgi:hypothetical protein
LDSQALAPIFAVTEFPSLLLIFDNIFQIKKLDPTSKRVSTVAGTGKAGFGDGNSVTAQVGRLLPKSSPHCKCRNLSLYNLWKC